MGINEHERIFTWILTIIIIEINANDEIALAPSFFFVDCEY